MKKLKGIILTAMIAAATTAQADVMRLTMIKVFAPGDTVVDSRHYDARSVSLIERYPNGKVLEIRFGEEDVDNYTNFLGGPLQTRIELLHPEKVGMEIDMPITLPLTSTSDYTLEFEGRVYLLDGADPTESYEGFVDAMTINTEPVGDNIARSDLGPRVLKYNLGGDHGTEAKFKIQINSSLSYTHEIFNFCDCNSFIDRVSVRTQQSESVIESALSDPTFNFTYSAQTQTYGADLPLKVNPYIVRHGAIATFELDQCFYFDADGRKKQIKPSSVKFDPAVEIGPDRENPTGAAPTFHIDVNCDTLGMDQNQEVYCWLNLKSLELNEGAPEWLKKLNVSEHYNNIALTFSIKPADATE